MLDAGVRPRVHAGPRSLSAFHACGTAGFLLALALGAALTEHAGLSWRIMAGMAVASAATFFAVAMATKIARGHERLTYYHHALAIVAACAALLLLLREPVAPYLDVVVLGVGVFLACGRIGCLAVGCCHGRPHRWGVQYRLEHCGEGFPACLVGVRLFPVQLLESLLVLAIVQRGAALVFSGARPGEALAWFVLSYGAVRFVLELARGDVGRPHWYGVSEAQWTSCGLMAAVSCAGLAGVLPLHAWGLAATAMVCSGAVALAAVGARRRLFEPRHVRQIAEWLRVARGGGAAPEDVRIADTDFGLRISAGAVTPEAEVIAFSAPEGLLSDRSARRLARLIAQLAGAEERVLFGKGSGKVYHVILPAMREAHVV